MPNTAEQKPRGRDEMRDPFVINGISVKAGSKKSINLPIPKFYTNADSALPLHVMHGKQEGPILFVLAAVHGDEINGVEIIRRLIKNRRLGQLRGTLLAVPIVNIYGFINGSRYSPDRRDLNRSFPGSSNGSLTAQLAHVLISEVVSRCTHGIDLHTGSNHRTNLPQLRVCYDEKGVDQMAQAFGAPVIVDSSVLEGSLRAYVTSKDIPLIVYEGGEPLRYEEKVIQTGLRGVLGVMRKLDMIQPSQSPTKPETSIVCRETTWVRAPKSGILYRSARLGSLVKEDEVIGRIADPFGSETKSVTASKTGVIIGKSTLPLVHRGDALFHIGHYAKSDLPTSLENGYYETNSPGL